jgi:exoribonuclease R
MKYKILISDKSYQNYNFVNAETNEDILLENEKVDPVKEKLFTKDIFSIENGHLSLLYSHVRSGITIAGVLMLENNKTFGRTSNKKRLLYKCIPDDKHLPSFLVPYEVKIGFSKVQKNKYVIFKFDHWDSLHPQGILLETLGDVGDPNVFYEYQLYCKNLHVSITNFTNKTKELFLKKSNDEYIQQILKNPNFHIEDRRDQHIFSIDPVNSLDFDDAFGLIEKEDGSCIVSIYIANVYFWLEILHLWKSFSSRVSTIYLPDRRRPMLPTILSDNLCSLQQNETRFAFVMDVFLDKHHNIIKTEYKNSVIQVYKNYRYEESDLLYNCPKYNKLLEITMKQDEKMINSHDVVAFWMVYMNKTCGLWMMEKQIGVFRSVYYKNKYVFESLETNKELDVLPPETQRVIKTWNNTAGQYVVYNQNAVLEHEIMKMKCYIHITSPIRRIIDLLNQFWIMKEMNLISNPSQDSIDFFQNWLHKMDYINDSMRTIRKVQTDCEIIHQFFTQLYDSTCESNNEMMNQQYQGTVFGKIVKNDGSIHYMVFIESIQLLARINTHVNVPNYSKQSFKIFLFEDEHKVKKMIRLQIL